MDTHRFLSATSSKWLKQKPLKGQKKKKTKNLKEN